MFDLEDAKKRGCFTRAGHKVRILCDNRSDAWPLIALHSGQVGGGGGEGVWVGRTDGRHAGLLREWDLVNLPQERTAFVCMRETGGKVVYNEEAYAQNWCERRRAAGYAAGYAPVTIKLTR